MESKQELWNKIYYDKSFIVIAETWNTDINPWDEMQKIPPSPPAPEDKRSQIELLINEVKGEQLCSPFTFIKRYINQEPLFFTSNPIDLKYAS